MFEDSFGVQNRSFPYVRNDDAVRGIVGCNWAHYCFSNVMHISSELELLAGAMVELGVFDGEEAVCRTLVTEWGAKATLSVRQNDHHWQFTVTYANSQWDVSYRPGDELREVTEQHKDLAFWLSVLVYDEEEADYFADMAVRLSLKWDCADLLQGARAVRRFLVGDMVRIKREKLAERASSLESLLQCLSRCGMPVSERRQAICRAPLMRFCGPRAPRTCRPKSWRSWVASAARNTTASFASSVVAAAAPTTTPTSG